MEQNLEKNPRILYKCPFDPQCKASYTRKSRLTVHVKYIHEQRPRPHSCQFCEKKFIDKSGLTIHLTSHTKEKKFLCRYCDMRFTTRPNQRDHERRHLNIRPYKCKKCLKCYFRKYQLIRHQNQCKHNDDPHLSTKSIEDAILTSSQNLDIMIGDGVIAEKDSFRQLKILLTPSENNSQLDQEIQETLLKSEKEDSFGNYDQDQKMTGCDQMILVNKGNQFCQQSSTKHHLNSMISFLTQTTYQSTPFKYDDPLILSSNDETQLYQREESSYIIKYKETDYQNPYSFLQ